MTPSAYHLRSFYRTLGGRIVRRLIRERVSSIWPDSTGLTIMGAGYAGPFLRGSDANAERAICVMFTGQGVHRWPDDAPNRACLADEADLPFETNSIDRVLLVHSLEFTGFTQTAFQELWRVLKSSGRILVIVPNRLGLWARADWTPFGRGTPYTARQVEEFLKDNLFIPERTDHALFIPPFKSQTLLRSAGLWEKAGRKLLPGMGGVLFVEAAKQIYASPPIRAKTAPSHVRSGVRPLTGIEPA